MSKSEQLRQGKKNHVDAYAIITTAILVGGGSLLLYVVFLYFGSLNIVELDLKDKHVLWFNSLLCLAFFVQHSSMIRASFRQKVESFIPQHYYGAFYAVCSGATLLAVIIFWQESSYIFMTIEGPLRWLLHLTFFLAISGLVWGIRSLRSFDAVGRGKILAHIHNRKLPKLVFSIRGPYRYVRHPFYFLVLVMVWSYPVITLDRLLFNCLWSVWIVVGTLLEERDLVIEFGQDYKKYQQKVPMLIPWKINL